MAQPDAVLPAESLGMQVALLKQWTLSATALKMTGWLLWLQLQPLRWTCRSPKTSVSSFLLLFGDPAGSHVCLGYRELRQGSRHPRLMPE